MRVQTAAGGLSFFVRLTPKGGRDAVEGWAAAADGSEHLKARVRSVPEDGKANAALLALLAKTLAVPKSSLRLASGATSRLKRIEIAGQNPSAIAAKLEAL
ncbi:MAG: DUF167 family protein [Rhizomicrobium sp.]|nr:DUF167 family protein [Rhizomicrobium sp.]